MQAQAKTCIGRQLSPRKANTLTCTWVRARTCTKSTPHAGVDAHAPRSVLSYHRAIGRGRLGPPIIYIL